MRYLLLICGLLCFGLGTTAQEIRARVLADSLFIPWEIIYGPDDHLWFTQKNGHVCRMDTGGLHIDTLLDEPATITIRESGMLGMTLHPKFVSQPYVYVAWEYMRAVDSLIFEKIVRYTYDPGLHKLISPLVLIDSITGGRNHNGCRLVTDDSYLYCTVADAADTTLAQNMSSLNGKILRINTDGSIPADNPWPGSPVWTVGHRNVQGLVMAGGRLYASEHGPNTDDEINLVAAGRNYGWPFVRGYCDLPTETTFCNDSGVAEPLQTWTPTIAPCGVDYYDHRLFPAFSNSLLLTTLKDKHLWQLKMNEDGTRIVAATRVGGVDFGRLRDLCVSPAGKIYITTSNSNADGVGPFVDKIVELTPSTFSGVSFALFPNPASAELFVGLPESEHDGAYYITDAEGKTVMSGHISGNWMRVMVRQLPPGIYWFRYSGKTKRDVRFMVVH